MNLQDLALIKENRSHRSSSWDRTGGNIDCMTDLAPGSSQVLLDTEGPGKITHIWATVMEYAGHPTVFRDMVLRMYWDGASVPSVEVPLGDFFGLGHGLPPPFYAKLNYQVVATPITVGVNERSMNCYFPMPFHRSARIELYNNGRRTLKQLYFHVDYELGEQPADCGLFHALFRQERDVRSQEWINLGGEDNYVLMETEGRGHYVGCFYYVDNDPSGWWGEGDDMIFIDRAALPTINGTGTEDYFGNAWCYHQPFSYPNYGCPLLEKRSDGGSYTTMYRFHLADPVRFAEHIRVTMEHVWGSHCTNSLISVAFWYQQRPLPRREPLPAGDANHARAHPGEIAGEERSDTEVDVPGLEVSLRENGWSVRTAITLGQQWIDGGALVVATGGAAVEVAVPVAADGLYRVEVKPVYGLLGGPLEFGLRGGPAVEVPQETLVRENDGPFVTLGNGHAEAGQIRLIAQGDPSVPLHRIRLTKLD